VASAAAGNGPGRCALRNASRIAAEDHLHPGDLLPTARSVIVFFIPFRKDLVRENRKGDRPCRNWGLAYVQTNDLINRLSRSLGDLLNRQGFQCGLTPATHNFSEAKLMAAGPTSIWAIW